MQQLNDSRRVRVYWDYENCRIPAKADRAGIIQRIRTLVNEQNWGKIDKHLLIYADFPLETGEFGIEQKRREFKEWALGGVDFVLCPHDGKKDVVDKRIITSMLHYATHEIPADEQATFVLITGDGDFTDAVLTLTWLRHTVVVISGPRASRNLTKAASVFLDWRTNVVDKAPKRALSQGGAVDSSIPHFFVATLSRYHIRTSSEDSDARFLIPRSFEVLIRCLQNHPFPTITRGDLFEEMQRQKSELWEDVTQFEDFLEYARSYDIVKFAITIQAWNHDNQIRVVYLQKQWWDGFD